MYTIIINPKNGGTRLKEKIIKLIIPLLFRVISVLVVLDLFLLLLWLFFPALF